MNYQTVFARAARYMLGPVAEGDDLDASVFLAQRADLEALFNYHELISAVYPCFKKMGGWEDVAAAASGYYYGTVSRVQVLEREFTVIASEFRAAGVPMVPLKGVALLQDAYRQRPLRMMSDIDLLVRPASLDKAAEIMAGLGYAQRNEGLHGDYWRHAQCHLQFSSERPACSAPVDLHFGLDYRRRGRMALEEAVWERARDLPAGEGGDPLLMLSAEDAVLSLVLHQRRSLKPLCLKYAVDLAALLRFYGGRFDREYLFSQAAQEGMVSGLHMLLALADIVFPREQPHELMRQAPLSCARKRRIERFVVANVFSLPALRRQKELFLASHFLQFDQWGEPVRYILGIPQEQFAKFYALAPYAGSTRLAYQWRFVYVPFCWCRDLLASVAARLLLFWRKR